MNKKKLRLILASAVLAAAFALRCLGSSEPSSLRRLLCGNGQGAAAAVFSALSEGVGEGEKASAVFSRCYAELCHEKA